ncbi:MAG TPA: cytochrome c biogenesis protein CcdA [Jiangellaceae bacterium]|nr:cytochrome c biogenesis protein CcdA [Jiangellaceae bacterium]
MSVQLASRPDFSITDSSIGYSALGQTFGDAVLTGPLVLGLLAAAVAGLVSFLSPCVLPLVPGYLSYVSGLSGMELDGARRSRMVSGALLFVIGFTAVFVSYGALFGGLGSVLIEYAGVITRVMGVLLILLGVVFAGWLPGMSRRQWRIERMPGVGLVGAPLVGAFFAIGWTPCIGPTLAAVQVVAFDQADAGRGALLSSAYALGLGAPFVLAALAYHRSLRAFRVLRRHQRTVMRVGGVVLILIGLMLLTGLWAALMASLQGWILGFEVIV